MAEPMADLLSGLLTMPGMTEKLQTALNAPDTAEKLQGLLSSLGGDAAAKSGSAPPALPTALTDALRSGGEAQRDEALLHALRPYLKGDRVKRLDDALRLLQLMRLLTAGGGRNHDE